MSSASPERLFFGECAVGQHADFRDGIRIGDGEMLLSATVGLSLPVGLDGADPDELVAHLEDQDDDLPAVVLDLLQVALELADLCPVLTLLLSAPICLT